MDKLTDLDLEKRIAEIEGIEVSESVMMGKGGLIPTGRGLITDEYIEFNPLTDKAMLLDLIFGYGISICRYRDCVYIDADHNDRPPIALASLSSEEEFPRAVLEVIAEANNG